jgi:hypothetical protein
MTAIAMLATKAIRKKKKSCMIQGLEEDFLVQEDAFGAGDCSVCRLRKGLDDGDKNQSRRRRHEGGWKLKVGRR